MRESTWAAEVYLKLPTFDSPQKLEILSMEDGHTTNTW